MKDPNTANLDLNSLFAGIIGSMQEERAFQSMGKSSFHVFKGAINAGATDEEAMSLATAFITGLLIAANTQQKEDNDQ